MSQSVIPPVGVAVPTFNRAGLLRNCLASLERQGLSKELLQVHVSDNASGDYTPEVVASFQGLNINYHRQPENVGYVANINGVFRMCRNKYILTLCDDDWLEDGYLRRAYEFLERNESVVMYSAAAAYRDDRSGAVISVMRPMLYETFLKAGAPGVLWQNDDFIAICAVQTPVFFGTALMRGEAFQVAMLDDMEFYYSKEKIYFSKLLKYGSVYTEAGVGAHVRWHAANMTKGFDDTASAQEFRGSTRRVIELAFEQGIDVPDYWRRKLAQASQEERGLIADKMASGFAPEQIAALLGGNGMIFDDIRKKYAPARPGDAGSPPPPPTLAIFTPNLGAVSETFIRQHIELLAPGRTVVIAANICDASWVEAPVLNIPFSEQPFGRCAPSVEDAVCAFLKEHNVTHILCEFACFGTDIVELNHRRLGLPIFVHFFGGDASEWLKFPEMAAYYRWMAETVTGVVTIAQPMTRRLVEAGLPEQKIHCIHLGIPVEVPLPAAPENEPCRFVSVTRMVPKKGVPYLIQAFKLAHDLEPGITLDIIGGDNSAPGRPGPVLGLVQEMIRELDLGASVRLHGARNMDYVFDCFARSSVYVQHSITDPETGDAEGLPVAIMQAASAGLPVLSTRHEGIPEEVEHGATGLLVEEFDVPAMASYMVLLAREPQLRKTMGEAAREKIAAEFDFRVSISRLRDLIGLNAASGADRRCVSQGAPEGVSARAPGPDQADAAAAAEKPSIAFINTYYEGFLREHYARNPQLSGQPYAAQQASLESECFGDSDFYSSGLKRSGWQAQDYIVNVPPLQAAWAKENGFGGEGFDIAVEQIRRRRPDVVYLQDLNLATREFLLAIRPHTRLIVGQIASPLPSVAYLDGFDVIISSFPHFAARFRAAGIAAYYQPLAFDPRVLERTPDAPRDIPLSFVGGISPNHGKGLETLEKLAGMVPLHFWGYGAAHLGPDSIIAGRHHGEAWGRGMFTLLRRSRITLNRHIDVAEDYANNMRLFEATGCGALLITDYKENLDELFEIGKEVVAYRSPEECAALIQYYLAHPEEAEAIARAGQARTLRDHSYARRMEETALILERHLRAAPRQKVAATPQPAQGARPDAALCRELEEAYQGGMAKPFRVLAEALAPHLRSGDSVLQIGCQSGLYSGPLSNLLGKELSYTGVDPSPQLIGAAQKLYPEHQFFAANGSNLLFEDGTFDIVICTLPGADDYRERIFEAARVAKRCVVLHQTPVRRPCPAQLAGVTLGQQSSGHAYDEELLLREFSALGLTLLGSFGCGGERDDYAVTYLLGR